MKEIIALCGDNCSECPRYRAYTDEERRAVAELWAKVGWRDHVVTVDEIACAGCSPEKQCTYRLVECTEAHRVPKCSRCGEFPCAKIDAMLERTAEYQKKCKEICTDREYASLEKAFFLKSENLKK